MFIDGYDLRKFWLIVVADVLNKDILNKGIINYSRICSYGIIYGTNEILSQFLMPEKNFNLSDFTISWTRL